MYILRHIKIVRYRKVEKLAFKNIHRTHSNNEMYRKLDTYIHTPDTYMFIGW